MSKMDGMLLKFSPKLVMWFRNPAILTNNKGNFTLGYRQATLFPKFPIKWTVKFNACFVKHVKAPFKEFHRPRFLENTDAILTFSVRHLNAIKSTAGRSF
jgi:hypothetical protein